MKWLALLLLAPAAAWADPVSIGAALLAAAKAVTVAQVIGAVAVAAQVFGAARQRSKARAAAARQKREHNASLQDRTLTLLQANPPHRVIYGRCITGGDVVAIFTSDKTGTRQNGSTFTKADAYKHMVIVLAAHEVQAIHDVFVDGVSIGPLDGSGWVTVGDFFVSNKPVNRQATIGGGGYVDVSPAASAVIGGVLTNGAGLDAEHTTFTPTLSMSNTRISGPAGGVAHYTVANPIARIKVDKHLGTTGQTVSTYLNSVAASQWTSNHRLRGLAYVVVTLDLDEPRFQAGPPQLSFDVSGKKVHDPRTGTTAWSENAALCVRDYLMSVQGYGVASADIDLANADADACDARLLAAAHAHSATCTASSSLDTVTFASPRWFSTGDGVRFTTTGTLPAPLAAATTYYVIATADRRVFKLATSLANAFAGTAINLTNAGSGTHTGTWYDYAAYTCNGAFSTDGSGKEAVLEDLAETMAGTVTYGAKWIIKPGVWSASVMSLTDDDIDGQIEIVQAGAGLDATSNGVRGQYIPTGKGTPTDFQPYQNATFLAADGQELWEDVALPFVNNKVRAANLARIKVEQARDGLVIRYPAKLKAWPLQIGDRVTVSSAEYGWSSKTFRVTDWQFGAATAVVLTLQEDAAAIYDLADAVTADPAPNTGLPSPWQVGALSGVSASSGAATAIVSSGALLIPRILISWSAIADPYVTGPGGAVEIYWQRPGGSWVKQEVPGDSTSVYVTGPAHGEPTLIMLYARNGLGAVGPATFLVHTVDGSARIREIRDGNGNLVIGTNGLSPTGVTSLAFFDGFETPSVDSWTSGYGSSIGELSIVAASDASAGGHVLRLGNNAGNDLAWLIHNVNIMYEPEALYRVKASVRQLSGTGAFYLGLVGVAADGSTFVNTVGDASHASQHYVEGSGAVPGSSWTTFVGYARGRASTGASPLLANPSAAGALHEDVRYIRPAIVANYPAETGQCEVSFISIERLGGSIGTAQLGPAAASAGSITSSSETTGSTGSPGASVSVFTMYGPGITCEAGDELNITVSGFANFTFWSTPAIGKVRLYFKTSPSDLGGGGTTERGTRLQFPVPVANSAIATDIPMDHVLQYVPGAGTLYYHLDVRIEWYDSAGSAKTCADDFVANLQWHIVRRKR